jgi:hypothetical protein
MYRCLPFALWTCVSLSALVLAPDDWAKPCFSGGCSYETEGSSTSSAAASLQPERWSTNNNSISDVTEAAGWFVLGCDSSIPQDIRPVCNSNDMESSGCSHLCQGGGALNMIVRLPATVNVTGIHT